MSWFRRKTTRMQPEARWTVSADVAGLTITDPGGQVAQVPLDDLSGVIIETNDMGPFATDVWWLLFGPDDRLVGRFPLGATGQDAALYFLAKLPGFDHGQMALAMGSTEVAVFPVWRRE